MNENKVFMFVVNNSDARYSNVVRIDEENGNYCLNVSLTKPSCISYTAKISKNDLEELFSLLKPVNEWGSQDSQKREILDTTWFIFFNYHENIIRANGYKNFPDDYDIVANEISNWLIAILKRENDEFNKSSQEGFKKSLTNKPRYIFSCFANASMPYSYNSITIEQKGDVYFLDSSSSDDCFPNRSAKISEEYIDKLCELFMPLINCKRLNNDIVLDGETFSLSISYNDLKFSAENFYNESIDFSKIKLDMKKIIFEIS